MEVLVVLPTYNEAANIDTVLRRVRSAVPAATVLVVDDGSPDGTAEIAETIGKELGNIEILRRHQKSGLGSAYRDGFRWGLERDFDACVEMDSDLSHEPEALPHLVGALTDGCEVVIGSRYVPGGQIPNWAWHRRLLSRGGNVYASCSWAWVYPTRRPAFVPTRHRSFVASTSMASGPTATASRSR